MEKIETYSTTEIIRSYQVGPGGHISLTSLFQLLQESAYQNAEELNWGYQLLQEKGWIWVLSRIRVLIHKHPKWNDKISIITTPYTPVSLWAPRDFQLFSEKGELLCDATSHWLLVDQKTMRPLPPGKLFGDLTFEKENGLCSLPISKIRGDIDEKPLQERPVFYSHLDVNRHMNNTRYIDFILDSLEPETYESIRDLEVHYQQEAFSGDFLQIHHGKDKENQKLRILKREGTEICSARIRGI